MVNVGQYTIHESYELLFTIIWENSQPAVTRPLIIDLQKYLVPSNSSARELCAKAVSGLQSTPWGKGWRRWLLPLTRKTSCPLEIGVSNRHALKIPNPAMERFEPV